MMLLIAIFSVIQVAADKCYQRDAPEGRWLEGEHKPTSARDAPEAGRLACPHSFDFCIDTRWSDARTCMYPNPHLIKRCYDEGCIRSEFGVARSNAGEEDTYCKDFMDIEGRFCQWTESVRCTCSDNVEDIVFANAVTVYNLVPEGYRMASECVYPSNNFKRMPNGAYLDVPVLGQPSPPAVPSDPKLMGDQFWTEKEEEDSATMKPLLNKLNSKSSAIFAGTAIFIIML